MHQHWQNGWNLDTILQVVGHDLLLLEVNAVVIIFREWGSSEVLTRKIARHAPPLQPWGINFSVCRMLKCVWKPYHFSIRNDGYTIHTTCRFCGWRSEWVDDKCLAERNVFKVDKVLSNIFWHLYLPLPSLENIFIDVTETKQQNQERKIQPWIPHWAQPFLWIIDRVLNTMMQWLFFPA